MAKHRQKGLTFPVSNLYCIANKETLLHNMQHMEAAGY